jgi:cysteine synthase
MIGHTSLVSLNRLIKHLGLSASILAKLEYFSPGASKKDRAAQGIIDAAEKNGLIKKGQTVVELTSGNMAAVLAGQKITKQSHPIQEGGYAIKNLQFFKDVKFDEELTVSGEEAIEMARL